MTHKKTPPAKVPLLSVGGPSLKQTDVFSDIAKGQDRIFMCMVVIGQRATAHTIHCVTGIPKNLLWEYLRRLSANRRITRDYSITTNRFYYSAVAE